MRPMIGTLRHSLTPAGPVKLYLNRPQASRDFCLCNVCWIVKIRTHYSPQSVRKKGGPRHQGRVAPFVVPSTMLFVSEQLGGTRASNVDANKRPQPPRPQTDLLLKAGIKGRGGERTWRLVTAGAERVLGEVLVDPSQDATTTKKVASMMPWVGQMAHGRV